MSSFKAKNECFALFSHAGNGRGKRDRYRASTAAIAAALSASLPA